LEQEFEMAKKGTNGGKPMSKSEIYASLAESTGLTKKQVASVFEGLSSLIGDQVGKKGPGVFTVPGLMKVIVQHKPATKAYKGVNRFTGEEQMFKAKPARNVVKVRALKGLKDMV
jgi:nucleoid DNA-binding protein